MTKLAPPTPRCSKALYRDVRGANLVEYIILVGVVALIALAPHLTQYRRAVDIITTSEDNFEGRRRRRS